MNRWRDNVARKLGIGNLVDFHTRNKLQTYLHPHPLELKLRTH